MFDAIYSKTLIQWSRSTGPYAPTSGICGIMAKFHLSSWLATSCQLVANRWLYYSSYLQPGWRTTVAYSCQHPPPTPTIPAPVYAHANPLCGSGYVADCWSGPGMLAQRNTHTHTQSKVESTLCVRVVDVRQHRNYTSTNR